MMQFAHTLGEGGPEIEFLIIAGAMLLLGIVFFMQKSVKPVVSVVLVIGAFAMTAGAFAVGGSDTASAQGGCGDSGSNGDTVLTIAAPQDGGTVPADEPFRLEIDLQGGTGDRAGGHFDISVDGELETMTSEPNPKITFSAGEHELRVEYVNRLHEPFDPPIYDIACETAE
jgi:hypothetical protein